VTFLASPDFTKTEYDFATLEHRLRELAFLNSRVRIVLTASAAPSPRSPTCSTKAASRPSPSISTQQAGLHSRPVSIRGEREGITVEVAMQ